MDAKERRKWLISVSEKDAGNLTPEEWYDRTRLLREIEAHESIKNNPPRVDTQNKEISPQRSYNSPKRVYNNWTN